MKKERWKDLLITSCDVLFVLVLCLAILLTTMLLTKSADGTRNSAYTLRPVLLGGVVLSTGAFVWFVLHNSLRSLREMVKHYFKKQRQEEDHSK
jgi:hypothetical protein